MSKDRASQRKPINDLIQAVGVGVKELKKAITAFDGRVKRREAPQSGTKKRGRQTKAPNTVSAFDSCMEKSTAIATVEAVDLQNYVANNATALQLPMIIKIKDEVINPVLANASCQNMIANSFALKKKIPFLVKPPSGCIDEFFQWL